MREAKMRAMPKAANNNLTKTGMDPQNTQPGTEHTTPETSQNDVPTGQTLEAGGENKSSAGPLIAVVIIVALLVLGALYYFRSVAPLHEHMPTDEAMMEEDQILEELTTQSQSDVLADIEADLDATALDELDKELSDIESEL